MDRISQTIRQKGKISYREVMQTLLYHRLHGFYTRYLRIGTGSGYHFSTRPIDFSPHYGQAFAKRIARFVELLGLDSEKLELVALGDGTGLFFRDILAELEKQPQLYARLNKTSLELVPRFAVEQQTRLARFGAKVITGSAVDLDRHFDSVSGVFFCNELIDQFPVHRVVNKGGTLLERYITFKGNELAEIDGPLSDPGIAEYFRVIRKQPQVRRSCVVNLEAFKLLRNLSKILKQGVFFIVDYNSEGANLNRIRHSRFGQSVPLGPKTIENAIGKDVTTDVDFSALRLIAKHFGFKVLFEISDAEFLAKELPRYIYQSIGYPMRVLGLAKE
ncbi:MAG: SAM-dependent methyltransferase [Candidatus Margulisbacteria bacterium]|nr:SAM-dependent methyltransferase [Candidatus Margulisiibacteriota bacterium]